jgi:hypothetical protein
LNQIRTTSKSDCVVFLIDLEEESTVNEAGESIPTNVSKEQTPTMQSH